MNTVYVHLFWSPSNFSVLAFLAYKSYIFHAVFKPNDFIFFEQLLSHMVFLMFMFHDLHVEMQLCFVYLSCILGILWNIFFSFRRILVYFLRFYVYSSMSFATKKLFLHLSFWPAFLFPVLALLHWLAFL